MLKKGLLETMMSQVEVFTPKYARVIIPPSKDIIHLIRLFYQGLNQTIFSGDLESQIELNGATIQPDTTDYKRQRYIEVKAAGHTRRVMLKDREIFTRLELQLSSSPIPNPRIYYSLYRYGMKGILGKFRDSHSEEVTQFLAENTKFMVGLPFSVILQVYLAGYEPHEFVSRKYGRGVPATHFSSSLFDLFLSSPEQAITSFGFNPEDFIIKKKKLADRVSLNGFNVNPFPLVLIKDTDEFHQAWIETIKK
ncbi:hypothetical protein HYW76_05165 [Candidatus Pacearchaeota archaeon]|nr:hypothetical protein [Candidatus Pacearchaeota archaeon]